MALKRRAFLPLLALLIAASVAEEYGEYDYGYGYDFYTNEDDFNDSFDDDGLGGAGSSGFGRGPARDEDIYYDEYGYYGDEDEQYYEYYGYYAEDFAGYEDYYDDEYDDFYEECTVDAAGRPVLSNTTASCDIKIAGVDTVADKLPGGIDGVYKLSSCYNGRAMYKRVNSPAAENRVLWYSSTYGDWDISKGSDPDEAEILMYGGEMEHASVPLFVTSWHLGADLKSTSGLSDSDYLPITASVQCADGKVYNMSTYNQAATEAQQLKQVGPILNDDEMEAKYKYIYDKYARADPSPTINFTFVVLLVMTGLTIVLAIPYFLLRKRGVKGSGSTSSFSQMLQNTRKKNSGHAA